MTDGEESMANRGVPHVQSCFCANLLKNYHLQLVHFDIGPVQEKQNALYISSRAGYTGKTGNFFGGKCGHFRTGNLSVFKYGRNEKNSVFKKAIII